MAHGSLLTPRFEAQLSKHRFITHCGPARCCCECCRASRTTSVQRTGDLAVSAAAAHHITGRKSVGGSLTDDRDDMTTCLKVQIHKCRRAPTCR